MPTTAVTARKGIMSLSGVGPSYAKDLAKLGIHTISDLLEHLPIRYETYGRPVTISQLSEDQAHIIQATLISITSRRSFRRRLTIQEGLVRDDSGAIKVTWFNQPYLTKLATPQKIVLRGKLSSYRGIPTLVSPEIVRDPDVVRGKNLQLPVYPLSGRLTTKQMRYWVAQALSLLKSKPDLLPTDLRDRLNLVDRKRALKEIHRPTSPSALTEARRRMTFEELFLLSLFVLRERAQLQSVQAQSIPANEEILRAFVRTLPFALTNAQRKAAWTIVQDLARNRPMNRLLEGDVGSGKTAVAAIATASVVAAKGQVAILAPTNVLAQQHAQSFRKMLQPFGVSVGLLAGSSIADKNGDITSRSSQLAAIASGSLQVAVGTHALLESAVTFKHLQLVIVDEQHRFGVEQRRKLKTKIHQENMLPHLLSMTATPIPRSLALTLYGDLDLSVLDEKPAGRQPIKTKVVLEKDLKNVWKQIIARAKSGQQAFVMYPLIEESEALTAKAVTNEIATLKKKLPGLRIGMMHGRLSQADKDAVMADFSSGKLDVLATTPVIEVGIDIPNASVMVIMSAERFGLAQLHQFRGRIGRGEHASICYVCPDLATQKTRTRLRLFETCSDGFTLAEEDLKERGPGEIYGSKQHGQVRFKFANILDARTLAIAKEEAATLLRTDPELRTQPLLKKRVTQVATDIHLE